MILLSPRTISSSLCSGIVKEHDGWIDVVRMPASVQTSEGGSQSALVEIDVLLQDAPGPANGVSDRLFEVKDEVAWITINRPRVLNAFREQTLDEMTGQALQMRR